VIAPPFLNIKKRPCYGGLMITLEKPTTVFEISADI